MRPERDDADSAHRGPTARRRRTIARLWRDAVAQAARPRVPRRGAPTAGARSRWAEAAAAVDELANGLLALGVRKGDAFAILGRDAARVGALRLRARRSSAPSAPPIYANSSPRDCAYVLEHSDAVGVLVEDEEQRAKVARRGASPHVLTFAELDELARARPRATPPSIRTRSPRPTAAIGEDDLFTFIYTSGTTGPPKACMIRHRNYYAMAAMHRRVDDFAVAGDVMLLYLPLAHNFGRLMHLLGAYAGYTIAFCPDPLRARRGAAGRAADGAAERAAGLREGARGRPRRSSTRPDGREAAAASTGRCGSAARVSELRQRGRPVPPALACSTGSPTGSSTRR